MNLMFLLGIAIVASLLALLLRQYRSEYGMLVELCAAGILFLYAVFNCEPVLTAVYQLTEKSGIPVAYLSILLKSLGICYLIQFGADLCRDAGESAIASKLELTGRVMVLLLSLPLFQDLMDKIFQLISE